MSAAHRDLTIDIGATWEYTVVWKDENSTRIDLTGCTAKMHIRDREGGDLILALTTENNRIRLQEDADSVGETQGVIRLTIDANATDAITRTSGVYDLKIYFTNGDVWRLLKGSVAFVAAITVDA